MTPEMSAALKTTLAPYREAWREHLEAHFKRTPRLGSKIREAPIRVAKDALTILEIERGPKRQHVERAKEVVGIILTARHHYAQDLGLVSLVAVIGSKVGFEREKLAPYVGALISLSRWKNAANERLVAPEVSGEIDAAVRNDLLTRVRTVLESTTQQPLRVNEIAEKTGSKNRTAQSAVGVLEAAGVAVKLAVDTGARGSPTYFVHARNANNPGLGAWLDNTLKKRVLDYVAENPGKTATEIAVALNLPRASYKHRKKGINAAIDALLASTALYTKEVARTRKTGSGKRVTFPVTGHFAPPKVSEMLKQVRETGVVSEELRVMLVGRRFVETRRPVAFGQSRRLRASTQDMLRRMEQVATILGLRKARGWGAERIAREAERIGPTFKVRLGRAQTVLYAGSRPWGSLPLKQLEAEFFPHLTVEHQALIREDFLRNRKW